MSLGTAFENLSRGPGMAYFPAISLSFKESVAFNFGSRPLRYPFPRRRGLLGSRGAGGEGPAASGVSGPSLAGGGRGSRPVAALFEGCQLN